MIYKNQILVFIISFLIAGFFLLPTPVFGGAPGPLDFCCTMGSERLCIDEQRIESCQGRGGTVCPAAPGCVEFEDPCQCQEEAGPTAVIPTLNEWGMIIMAGGLGLFAVIALFVMRRMRTVAGG